MYIVRFGFEKSIQNLIKSEWFVTMTSTHIQ